MKTLRDYLAFRKFIAPPVLQFMFWAGIGGTLYGTWWLYMHDNWAWIMALIFGPIGTRLIIEFLVIRYQTYKCLLDIKEKLDEKK